MRANETLCTLSSVILARTNQLLEVSETKGFIGAGLSLFAAMFVFGRQRCSWNGETSQCNNVSFSGGHYNPAVSLGALIAGHLTALDAILYVLMQIVGAFLGALLVEVR